MMNQILEAIPDARGEVAGKGPADTVAASRTVVREVALPEVEGSLGPRPLRILGQIFLSWPVPVWILVDAAVIWLGVVKGYRWVPFAAAGDHVQAWLAYGILTFCLTVCGLIFGLHERATLLSRWHIVIRMLLTTALSALLAYAIVYGVLYTHISRRVALVALCTYFLLGTLIRLFACYAIHRVKRHVVLVGPRAACESFVRRLSGALDAHHVVGFVVPDGDESPASPGEMAYLGTTRDVVRICERIHVQNIVVCRSGDREAGMMDWILPCLRLGCRVTNEATFYESAAGQILVDEITSDWFLFSDLKSHCDDYAPLKRAFDVVVAVVGLLVSLPMYPLLALVIKLEDGGPVFYSQDRSGKNGRVFKLYKFRTMRVDAESGRSVWATRRDPRVTRVGRFLRRTRLDEFPQFYNILMGQMSVVGPRPERPDIVESLSRSIPHWSERSLIKPGLTGWAQINFHYGSTLEDARRKLEYDFYYLKHQNLELDIIILFRTLGTFLRGAW